MIDALLERIPPGGARLIRLGALLLWLILATVVVFYSWSFGSKATPTSGQDLSLTTIHEKIEREKNLKNPPDLDITDRRNITIPDIGELKRESSPVIPYLPRPRRGNELEDSRPSPSGSRRESELPYLGSNRNREGDLYPPKYYIPNKDAGVGGARESDYREPTERTADRTTERTADRTTERTADRTKEQMTGGRHISESSTTRQAKKSQGKSIYPRRQKGSFGFLPP